LTDIRIQARDGRVRFPVRVQPRASRCEVVGAHGDALKVRLTAPPVDGAANEQLVELLARTFAVDRRAINILAGEGSRSKLVEIEGITERAVHDLVRRG
jgi:uncharacterized protein